MYLKLYQTKKKKTGDTYATVIFEDFFYIINKTFKFLIDIIIYMRFSNLNLNLN